MNTQSNDGGSAFPVPPSTMITYADGDHELKIATPGMTLRDYFAAAALQGRLARCGHDGPWSDMARYSYEAADAMLAERTKMGGGQS